MSDFELDRFCRSNKVLEPFAMADTALEQSGKFAALRELLAVRKKRVRRAGGRGSWVAAVIICR